MIILSIIHCKEHASVYHENCIFWALFRTNFKTHLTAGAKMSLGQAQNIFMPANLNSIVLSYITWGACIVIPAVVVSNTCSYCPAKRDTSVDVPDRGEGKTMSMDTFTCNLKGTALLFKGVVTIITVRGAVTPSLTSVSSSCYQKSSIHYSVLPNEIQVHIICRPNKIILFSLVRFVITLKFSVIVLWWCL